MNIQQAIKELEKGNKVRMKDWEEGLYMKGEWVDVKGYDKKSLMTCFYKNNIKLPIEYHNMVDINSNSWEVIK